MRLSRERISTFCGNVMPLRLLGGEDYNCEKITWRAEDPSVVQITVFSKNYPTGGEFTNGVLLTFLAAGKTAVTAKYAGRSYTCQVSARPMRRAVPSDEMQYFVGDMHDHTWNNHKLAEFSARAPEFYPIHHYMPCMRADGKMDFAVVSDHADIMNAREFFRGYADADQLDDSVIFFKNAASKDKTLKVYGNLFHEILNEYCKDEVIADMIAWMDARI